MCAGTSQQGASVLTENRGTRSFVGAAQASSRAIGRREIERSLPTEYKMLYHGERSFTAAEWALAVEFNKWVHNAGAVGLSSNQPMPVGVDGLPWSTPAAAPAKAAAAAAGNTSTDMDASAATGSTAGDPLKLRFAQFAAQFAASISHGPNRA
jgi:hypothetical protein